MDWGLSYSRGSDQDEQTPTRVDSESFNSRNSTAERSRTYDTRPELSTMALITGTTACPHTRRLRSTPKRLSMYKQSTCPSNAAAATSGIDMAQRQRMVKAGAVWPTGNGWSPAFVATALEVSSCVREVECKRSCMERIASSCPNQSEGQVAPNRPSSPIIRNISVWPFAWRHMC